MKHTAISVLAILFTLAGLTYSVPLDSQVFSLEDFPISIDGKQKALATCGGFLAPQFNQLDLNEDGLMDYVVFDRETEAIRTFLRTDESKPYEIRYAPRYEKYFPDAVLFLLARDFSDDGIADLFVGNYDSGVPGIVAYKSYYEDNTLQFTEYEIEGSDENILQFTSSSSIVSPINTTVIDLPEISDIDGDGDIDILLFNLGGGSVALYENLARDRGLGVDTFDYEITNFCWGGFYESDFSDEIKLSDIKGKCASPFISSNRRHSGSTILSLDHNSDGLADLLIGDLLNDNLVLLLNGGDEDEAWMVEQDIKFPSYSFPVNMATFLATFECDVNGDGRGDLVIAPNGFNNSKNTGQILSYENVSTSGEKQFVPGSDKFFPMDFLDLSASTVPAIADVTGDGLLDILVGTYGKIISGERKPSLMLFENTGSLESPAFELRDTNWLQVSEVIELEFSFAPTFGDIDGDGDEDLILGTNSGKLHFFENNAGPDNAMTFETPILSFMGIDVGAYSIPQLIDVNDDNLADLLIGQQNGNTNSDGELCGSVSLFINTGSVGNPAFDSGEEDGENNPCWGALAPRKSGEFRFYSSPNLVKLEDSWHLVLGGNKNGIESYRDISPLSEGEFAKTRSQYGQFKSGLRAHPRLANLDGDDYLELVLGGYGGGLRIFETNWLLDGSSNTSEASNERKQIFYPNPSADLIYMEEKISAEIREINIRNLSGTTVLKTTSFQSGIDLSGLPAGLYMVQVKMKSGEDLLEKIVLQ